jgi:NDP-sugar pyrophosphorylase family protein
LKEREQNRFGEFIQISSWVQIDSGTDLQSGKEEMIRYRATKRDMFTEEIFNLHKVTIIFYEDWAVDRSKKMINKNGKAK